MTSIRDWLQASPLPKLEARMLLQYVGGFTRAHLVAHDDEVLPEMMLWQLNDMQQARLDGVPMAYLLGEREFYGRVFQVTPAVLIPRPETELLVETVLQYLPQGGRVWDIGTGSGIIAITNALERSDATVHASDISAAAVDIARNNAGRLGAQVVFHIGSWYEVMPVITEPVDVLVSNPPYIHKDDAHLAQGDLRFEPQQALTDFDDGLNAYRALAADCAHYVKSQGWLMVEHGFEQAQDIQAIFQAAGLQQVHTLQDYAGLDRITLGQLRV
ncbi:peptide chain release factor N(5)-glutamine methyltransferase [Vitreoscilla massiliensis]|uniref:Release factor glutamine methyltransferase n=1 Tax=Vitreoscilla massiliensis TaxID=1689272 RepID=A0ABY4E427_9NEIS|nr:peptide chain release factor N(5)-glutamine methyltransferase [Vitreoscilla massiliensis]UOO90140.1 peptide chain release factor N(5)-glutamine methyltransferase [Vitreoscilla massiliensis]